MSFTKVVNIKNLATHFNFLEIFIKIFLSFQQQEILLNIIFRKKKKPIEQPFLLELLAIMSPTISVKIKNLTAQLNFLQFFF